MPVIGHLYASATLAKAEKHMRGGAAPREPVDVAGNSLAALMAEKTTTQHMPEPVIAKRRAPEVELASGLILGRARSSQPQTTAWLVGVSIAREFGALCPEADSVWPPFVQGCDSNG